jgi:predicted nuclease with RNAse H fold
MPRAKKPSGDQPSKAQRIRDVAKALGKKVRPRDVIEKLAKEGVKVTSPQVSSVLRAAGYRRKRRTKKVSAKSASAAQRNRLNVEALLATKALVAKLGSVEVAEQALSVLKKLG